MGASSRLDVIDGLIGVGWIHLSSRARCEHGGLCFALLMSGRTRWLDVTQLQIRIDVCDVSDSSCVVCLCVFDCVLLVALELEKGDFDCVILKARPYTNSCQTASVGTGCSRVSVVKVTGW